MGYLKWWWKKQSDKRIGDRSFIFSIFNSISILWDDTKYFLCGWLILSGVVFCLMFLFDIFVDLIGKVGSSFVFGVLLICVIYIIKYEYSAFKKSYRKYKEEIKKG